MDADRILTLLSGVRPCGKGRWRASCPAHQDKCPSLSIRQMHDRVLLHCWAGCTAAEVVAAIGLELADLYDVSRSSKPDPLALRRRRAAVGLEAWRQAEIRRAGENLRTRDTIIRQIDRAVQDGILTEAEALISLKHECRGYADLEHRFNRLLRSEDTLQLWRDSWMAREQ